jgi:hypothetical protein
MLWGIAIPPPPGEVKGKGGEEMDVELDLGHSPERKPHHLAGIMEVVREGLPDEAQAQLARAKGQ